jgi:hypothetical protein
VQIAAAEATGQIAGWLAAGWHVRETNANATWWWAVVTCE